MRREITQHASIIIVDSSHSNKLTSERELMRRCSDGDWAKRVKGFVFG